MSELNELDLLKAQADQLGITYHPNIGVDKLREKVQAKLNGETNTSAPEVETVTDTKTKSPAQLRAEAADEAVKLIRIRLTCMDPSKADYHGETISVGNDVVGNIKKFVPYREEFYENGYHVPNIIYKYLRSCKYASIKTIKGPKGDTQISVQANKYSIEVLPPLTPDELEALKAQQAASKSID
jgi:hypothetical protein